MSTFVTSSVLPTFYNQNLTNTYDICSSTLHKPYMRTVHAKLIPFLPEKKEKEKISIK